jgi:hypothetical protein
VKNVYGEIGTAFATCRQPRSSRPPSSTLVRGLGADRVRWGTDSVWYGSPQWQIEAMRRLEIPEDMRKQHKFAALGSADGRVKTAIFSGNASKLYNINVKAALGAITNDKIAAIRVVHRRRRRRTTLATAASPLTGPPDRAARASRPGLPCPALSTLPSVFLWTNGT